MTDDEIRKRVRERLTNGTLPPRAPATAPAGPGELAATLRSPSPAR